MSAGGMRPCPDPCSAIGTWRRNPDARWSIDRQAIPRLAKLQAQILEAAAPGVRTALASVFRAKTGAGEADGAAWLAGLRANDRYLEDIWGETAVV